MARYNYLDALLLVKEVLAYAGDEDDDDDDLSTDDDDDDDSQSEEVVRSPQPGKVMEGERI